MQPHYEPWATERVASVHGIEAGYRLFIGLIDGRKASVVLRQRGETADWDEALQRGEIAFDQPGVVFAEDWERIQERLAALRRQAAGWSQEKIIKKGTELLRRLESSSKPADSDKVGTFSRDDL